MTFFLPITLDFDIITVQNPINFNPYKQDKLAYILHKISSIPASNKNLDIVDGFVPLYSKALQEVVGNYKQYLDYAIAVGIIERTKSYEIGGHSKSCRFTAQYQGKLIPYTATDFSLIQNLRLYQKRQEKTVIKHDYLTNWFNPKLKIDYKKVVGFLEEEWQLKNDNKNLWDMDASRQKFKSPYLQQLCSKLAAEYITRGEYNLKIDDNVHRFHSNLTNMRGLVRNALTYDGQNLVAVDIKNSQPYFSTLLLDENFWKVNSDSKKDLFRKKSYSNVDPQVSCSSCQRNSKAFKTNKILKLENIKHNIKQTSIIMLGENMAALTNKGLKEDKNRFVDLVAAGALYEYLETAFKRDLNMLNVTRNTAKIAVLQAFFSDNRFIGTKQAAPKKLFSKLFPSVYKVYAAIKRKDKTLLAILLQNIESHFIVEVIARRIAKEYPKLPIFTIHDSIVTTVGNEQLVIDIMNDELTKGVGKAPKLKLEYWNPELIDDYLNDLKVRAGVRSA
ncbi:hypothetical protein [Flavobacterium soyangense]|uniref:Uncharacterized protein n=1 Tax=Flavobacterium soyangense TaxID=2023265 RepID=A0A930U6D7_9FLAO|nr:hypothetical protein [Flavobacterium soyangense]MBF2707738.1 hypothetical protein [Flavobacterium soyangense]